MSPVVIFTIRKSNVRSNSNAFDPRKWKSLYLILFRWSYYPWLVLSDYALRMKCITPFYGTTSFHLKHPSWRLDILMCIWALDNFVLKYTGKILEYQWVQLIHVKHLQPTPSKTVQIRHQSILHWFKCKGCFTKRLKKTNFKCRWYSQEDLSKQKLFNQ